MGRWPISDVVLLPVYRCQLRYPRYTFGYASVYLRYR